MWPLSGNLTEEHHIVKLPPRQSRLAVVILAVLADGREVLV